MTKINQVISQGCKQILAILLAITFMVGIVISITSSFSLSDNTKNSTSFYKQSSKDFSKCFLNGPYEETEDSEYKYGTGLFSSEFSNSLSARLNIFLRPIQRLNQQDFAYFKIPKYILFHHLKIDLAV